MTLCSPEYTWQFTSCLLAVILRLWETHFLVFRGLYGAAGNLFFRAAGSSYFRFHGFWPGVIVSQEVTQRMIG